eukprot:TRINITY_DN1885_c0_g1_i1.p1 TRINITY_DN1885_c0_g1~~TRINITY_DN1885_c0_g1_i1.p1  ORF type:complete len:288 (+),score=39.07 TRINITY_DN1885_c0_g1_i1:1017-1880(+)
MATLAFSNPAFNISSDGCAITRQFLATTNSHPGPYTFISSVPPTSNPRFNNTFVPFALKDYSLRIYSSNAMVVVSAGAEQNENYTTVYDPSTFVIQNTSEPHGAIYTYIDKCSINSTYYQCYPSVTLNSSSVFSSNTTNVIINGGLSLSNNSFVTLGYGQTVTVTGCINFGGGTLNITVPSGNDSMVINSTLYLFKFNCSSSQFSDINVASEDGCKNYQQRPKYDQNDMSILFTSVQNQCDTSNNNKKTANTGLIVGIGGCPLIVLIVLLLVGIVSVAYRHRDRLAA